MRVAILLSLMVLAGCAPMAGGPRQSSVGVSVNIQLGPELPVVVYARERHGDWRTSYQQWQPTTVYIVDGRFYDRETRGARAVVVYRRDHEYFLPPQDKEWVGKDKRYDYKRKPKDEDYRGRGGKP